MINGKEIKLPFNANIYINNNTVNINGEFVGKNKDIIYIYGDVQNIETDKSVNCNNVKDDIKAGGNVNCDDIGRNVSTGGSVRYG